MFLVDKSLYNLILEKDTNSSCTNTNTITISTPPTQYGSPNSNQSFLSVPQVPAAGNVTNTITLFTFESGWTKVKLSKIEEVSS